MEEMKLITLCERCSTDFLNYKHSQGTLHGNNTGSALYTYIYYVVRYARLFLPRTPLSRKLKG